MALTEANEARLRKSLQQLIQHNGRVITTEQFITEVAVDFEEGDTPKIQFNRTKFNRMNNEEQAEYEKKLKERKPVYKAITKEGGYYEIPKMVYQHFINLRGV